MALIKQAILAIFFRGCPRTLGMELLQKFLVKTLPKDIYSQLTNIRLCIICIKFDHGISLTCNLVRLPFLYTGGQAIGLVHPQQCYREQPCKIREELLIMYNSRRISMSHLSSKIHGHSPSFKWPLLKTQHMACCHAFLLLCLFS